MSKLIRIRKGDEYRIRVNKTISKDDFFYDSYLRAARILGEIADELNDYRNEQKQNVKNSPAWLEHEAKFRKMGNNIIAFCGGRGQGKTSVLQTFTDYIQKGNTENGEDLLGEDRKKFFVLDSIDPSSMEGAESVIRIVLSRLFDMVRVYAEKYQEDWSKERERFNWRSDIIDRFQQCYTNIDYLKAKTHINGGDNDLDVLAEMGSSARMKDNLYELVRAFLRLASDFEDEKKYQYLLVQIDDADLATKRVFQVYEDIRNYLSIPNVIIMVAHDYEQLSLAIYQRYIKQYQKMYYLAEDINMAQKCHEMTAQYLEKMFPIGHRIALTDLAQQVVEKHEEVRLEYEDKKGSSEDFIEIIKKEGDIQEQLFRVLYFRTGIVLTKEQGKFHRLLPHTMRELSQVVRMLRDMHDIVCDRVYDKQCRQPGDIVRLQDNLAIFKQYFLVQWCAKNLQVAQKQLMEAIEDAGQGKDLEAVCNILKEYKRRIDAEKKQEPVALEFPGDMTYYRLMHEVIDMCLEEKDELRMALAVYYTILLNEWFTVALGKDQNGEREYQELAKFIGRPFDISVLGHGSKEGYNIVKFPINMERLKSYSKNVNDIQEQAGSWLSRVGIELDSDEKQTEFDLFAPIMSVLRGLPKAAQKREDTTNSSADRSDIDTGSERRETENIDAALLIALRVLLTNYEVQRAVQHDIFENYRKMQERRKGAWWKAFVEGLYQKVDERILDSQFTSQEEKGDEKKISERCVNTNEKILAMVFLSNDENYDLCVQEYYSDLLERFTTLKDEVKKIKKELEGHHIENAEKQIGTMRVKATAMLSKLPISLSGVLPKVELEENVKEKGEEKGEDGPKLEELYEIEQNYQTKLDNIMELTKRESGETQKIKKAIDDLENLLEKETADLELIKTGKNDDIQQKEAARKDEGAQVNEKEQNFHVSATGKFRYTIS